MIEKNIRYNSLNLLLIKLQFFKSFILPYFDYCMSIYIYFPKLTLQKINNSFNFCLFKLFKFKINSEMDNLNEFNNFLEKYKLFTFQHRLIHRVLLFTHKIINKTESPINLKNQINKIDISKVVYSLREPTLLKVPRIRTHYGENTFSYFFNMLLNKFCINDINLNFNLFKNRMFNNINLIFIEFISYFPKFNLAYKHFYF